ncbi:MAG: S-methyl-5-thioribose kinase [Bacillota bacterium]|nr:S-methyl-5-thioribose kinase [Bacillota bacterium]MDW7678400.1 S-methyl-5-thioribose kinase [Bacillota bacterium]
MEPLNVKTVVEFMWNDPIGTGIFSPSHELRAEALGEQTLNLVFRVWSVQDPGRSVILKQALPYVSRIGKGWPLTPERLNIEAAALQLHHICCPERVPELYRHDPQKYIMIMQDLQDRQVVRKAFNEGKRFNLLGKQMGKYMGQVLGKTSDFGQPTVEKRKKRAKFANPYLSRLTEDLILINPFKATGWGNREEVSERKEVQTLRSDPVVLERMAKLRYRYRNNTQALLHGDLHLGSILADQTSAKVIDLEFATYGPMGFDVGTLTGSLLINWVAQNKPAYHLKMIDDLWETFTREIRTLWKRLDKHDWPMPFLESILHECWKDTAGYAAAEMVRRVAGMTPVTDLEEVENAALRREMDCDLITMASELLRNPGSEPERIREITQL